MNPLGISENGIVVRREDQVVIYRPGRHGGPGNEVQVDKTFADEHTLSTGDTLAGSIIRDEHVIGCETINGLALEAASERPLPRPVRNALERSRPDHRIHLSVGEHDVTG